MTTLIRNCHGCGVEIECVPKPIAVAVGLVLTPKFNAPLICKTCRLDPDLFHKARSAMHEYFGWDAQPASTVPMGELTERNPTTVPSVIRRLKTI